MDDLDCMNRTEKSVLKITRLKIGALYIPLFTWALFLSMLGQLVPFLRSEFGFSMAQTGLFMTMQSIGSMISILFCMLFLDTFNKIKSLGLAILLFGLFVAAIGYSAFIFITLSVFVLIGLSSGMNNTLSNAVISDLLPDKKSSYLNLTHAFFGLGGILGSMGASLFASMFGGRGAFIVFGVISVVFALYYIYVFRQEMRLPLMPKHLPVNQRISDLVAVIRRKGMKEVIVASILFAYFQVNILFWGPSFYIEESDDPLTGALALTLFFAGTALSRFIGSKFANKYKPHIFIFLFGILTAAAVIASILFSNLAVSLLFFGIIGFAAGNILPQLFAQSCAIAPDKSSVASGLVLMGYTLMAFVAPPMMGFIGDTWGLRYGFILMAATILLAGLVSRSFKKISV